MQEDPRGVDDPNGSRKPPALEPRGGGGNEPFRESGRCIRSIRPVLSVVPGRGRPAPERLGDRAKLGFHTLAAVTRDETLVGRSAEEAVDGGRTCGGSGHPDRI